MSGDSTEKPLTYRVRLSQRAAADIDTAFRYMIDINGQTIADQWIIGLRDTIATLATAPIRSLAPESSAFLREVRQTLYRRRPRSVAYRILFYVDSASLDGPTVTVLHVRHGARAPISLEEAIEIEESE